MADYSIIGKRYGRLVVLSLDHKTKRGNTYWLCQCDCGNKVVVYRGGLTSGDTTSCGCYHKEHANEYGYKHGLSCIPLYTTWAGMKARCKNKNAHNYERYGMRGIQVCEEWDNDFASFYNWAINNGYSSELTLDRIDNNENYAPENCRWVDRVTQQNNTRRNHKITYNGITHTLAEWSRILNVNSETLRGHVNKGNMNDFNNLNVEERRNTENAEF